MVSFFAGILPKVTGYASWIVCSLLKCQAARSFAHFAGATYFLDKGGRYAYVPSP
jgi:hypothetical protein